MAFQLTPEMRRVTFVSVCALVVVGAPQKRSHKEHPPSTGSPHQQQGQMTALDSVGPLGDCRKLDFMPRMPGNSHVVPTMLGLSVQVFCGGTLVCEPRRNALDSSGSFPTTPVL